MLNKKIKIPQQGSIELIDIMPHPDTGVSPDLAVVNAARVSYMGESKGDEADEKLLRYLIRNQHTSPLEQVSFKFRIRAPLMVFWQLVRHRVAKINMQSGRYTQFGVDDFYIPDELEWRVQSKDNKQMSTDERISRDAQTELIQSMLEVYPLSMGWANHINPDLDEAADMFMDYNPETYSDLLYTYSQIGYKIYESLVDQGVAKEQARLFLPAFAVQYTCVWKIDLHNLLKLLKLRMDDHAQWEIRQYANAMYDVVKHYCPWTTKAFEDYILKANVSENFDDILKSEIHDAWVYSPDGPEASIKFRGMKGYMETTEGGYTGNLIWHGGSTTYFNLHSSDFIRNSIEDDVFKLCKSNADIK